MATAEVKQMLEGIQVMARGSTIYLPNFSGDETKNDSTFEDWETAVNRYQAEDISDKTIKEVMRKSLRGQAKNVYNRMTPGTSIEDILSKLRMHFGRIVPSHQLWQDFYTMRQTSKMNVNQWWFELETKLDQISKVSEAKLEKSIRDKNLRTQFWTNLRESHIKDASRHRYDDSTVDNDELFQYIRQLENTSQSMRQTHKQYEIADSPKVTKTTRKTEKPRKVDTTEEMSKEELLEKYEELNKKFERLQRRLDPQPVPQQATQINMNKRDQCSYCKELGHWKRDCPVLRRKNARRYFQNSQTYDNTYEDQHRQQRMMPTQHGSYATTTHSGSQYNNGQTHHCQCTRTCRDMPINAYHGHHDDSYNRHLNH